MATSTRSLVDRFRPRRETLLWGALVCNTELFLILLYLGRTGGEVTNPLYLLLPFVWIDVAAWAVWRTPWPAPGGRWRALAVAVGAGYFLLLGWVGGVWALGAGHGGGAHLISSLPPGWSPLLHYAGAGVTFTLIPYEVAGYAALAYLVAATVADAARSAFAGVVGLFSCVSCTWPVLGTLAAAAFGSGSAAASAATNQPYELSTLVFLSAVVLLHWRPFGR